MREKNAYNRKCNCGNKFEHSYFAQKKVARFFFWSARILSSPLVRFAENKIGDEGAKALAAALKMNRTIVGINLSGMCFTFLYFFVRFFTFFTCLTCFIRVFLRGFNVFLQGFYGFITCVFYVFFNVSQHIFIGLFLGCMFQIRYRFYYDKPAIWRR